MIEKQIESLIGTPKSVKKLKNKTLLVETSRKSQSDNLLKISSFFGIKVSVTEHKSLNSSKGIIRDRMLKGEKESKIVDYLKEQGATTCKRFTITKDHHTIETNTLLWWPVCAISSFHGEKTPRAKTKRRKNAERKYEKAKKTLCKKTKRRNNAIRKDEKRHAKIRNFSAKRRKKKTPCEKTPFETLFLSSFRVASFRFFSWRLFAWRYFVLSSFCMASLRLFAAKRRHAKRRKDEITPDVIKEITPRQNVTC